MCHIETFLSAGKEQTEKCICCGEDTGIPLSVPVSARKNYIAGCGQLCENCSLHIEWESRTHDTPSDEELAALLEAVKNDDKERNCEKSMEYD